MKMWQTSAQEKPFERDYVTIGVALAAMVLFVGLASSVLPQVYRAAFSNAAPPDVTLVNALLLNIALIAMGWRRNRTLNAKIAQHMAAEREARELSQIDPLTGCLNRRNAIETFDALLAKCRLDGAKLAVFVIDLDNFKQVNDLNGHAAGDEVLQETVTRLRAHLPPDVVLARLGGDEFACAIAYSGPAPEKVDRLAQKLIGSFAEPFASCDHLMDITVSLGIACNGGLDYSGLSGSRTATKANANDLLHWADIAMYNAKKKGKNRYAWFEASMETDLQYRSDLERGIRDGIANGEFVPFYEQQIDISSGDLIGFEMLARWRSPELGLVRPDIFIPVAEDMGVIAELSESLMAQAFRDARDWAPHLTLSVNISQVQLRDPLFAQRILKLLVQHNFPASRLDLEITESCLETDPQQVRSIIASLRNQGIRISLDDFGTGYSSLSQLRTLPVDRLKIDRSFIASLRDKNADKTIVNAIFSLGNGLKMPITAEGIETAEVLQNLRDMGQFSGQGYHYGQPEDAASVTAMLASKGLLLGTSAVTREEGADDTGAKPDEDELRRSA